MGDNVWDYDSYSRFTNSEDTKLRYGVDGYPEECTSQRTFLSIDIDKEIEMEERLYQELATLNPFNENREMEEHVDWEEEEYADWEEQVQTTVEGYYNVANFEIQRKPNQELINSTMRISLPGMYGFKGSPKNIHETNGTIQIRNDSTDESDIANCQVWKNIGRGESIQLKDAVPNTW